MEEKVIKIEYHSKEIEKLQYIDGKSDWIDLRAAERVELKSGDFKLINLGVSMRIPEGYEAHIAPRSSTFKTWESFRRTRSAWWISVIIPTMISGKCLCMQPGTL